MMTDMIVIPRHNGELVTTSMAIAEGVGRRHRVVTQLVRQHLADLEEFGRVTFEMETFETAGGLQQRQLAMLNEQHATLLLTYMRNNDVVRAFKKRLVKSFFEMRQQILDKKPVQAPDPETSSRFFKACYEIGALVRHGDHNQAVLAANMATRNKFGIDFLGEMGMEALPAPEGERELLTPSDIGIELGGLSGQAVNKILERLGLQRHLPDGRGKKSWRVTDAGFDAGAKLMDTGKKHVNGTPIRQLKWEAGVVDLLKEAGYGIPA